MYKWCINIPCTKIFIKGCIFCRFKVKWKRLGEYALEEQEEYYD